MQKNTKKPHFGCIISTKKAESRIGEGHLVTKSAFSPAILRFTVSYVFAGTSAFTAGGHELDKTSHR
ncbi:hypothetical protein BH10ACI3_BH10ACI3_19010 [soil metagenome]